MAVKKSFAALSFLLLLLAGGRAGAQYVKFNDTFTLYYPTHGTDTVPKVYVKGAYKDSLPEGRWTFYHEMGNILEIHNYKRGLLNDTFDSYQFNADLRAKGFYSNNLKNGNWIEGRTTLNYVNDTLQGWQQGPPEGKEHQNLSEYIYFVNGVANGPYYLTIKYNMYDTLVRGQYINDKRDGLWIIKEPGMFGTTKMLNYKNNELEDTSYYFDENSVLQRTEVYRNGKKNGPEYTYHVVHFVGETKIYDCVGIINYQSGEIHGNRLLLSAGGDTLYHSTYVNGVKYGIETQKAPGGQLLKKHWHYAGSSYDSCVEWYAGGSLKSNYVVKSRLIGEAGEFHKSWDSTGRVTHLDTFYIKAGKRRLDIINYKNSTVVDERHFLEGKRYGRWYKKSKYEIYYDSSNWDKAIVGAPDRDEDAEALHEFNIEYERAGSGTYAEGNTDISHYPHDFTAPDRMKRNSATENTSYRDNVINYNTYYQYKNIADNSLHGTVVIKVYVNKFGYATCPVFVKSDKPELNSEALRLAMQTQWRPRRTNGYIIPVWKEMKVIF